MGRRFFPLAILLCAVASRAHGGQTRRPAADAGTHEQQAQPLSAEDAELVKQLAVLEDVDLLRNLDLFDDKSADPSKAPDAGSPDAGTASPPPPEPRQ